MGSLWLFYTFFPGSYWRIGEVYRWRALGNGSNRDHTWIAVSVSNLPGNSKSIKEEKSWRNCLLVWILEQELGKGAVKKLEKFIAGGYIRNIQIDREGNYIMITAPNRRVNEKIYITVTCPSCGAKNQVIKGRLSTCEYCGQRLTPW